MAKANTPSWSKLRAATPDEMPSINAKARAAIKRIPLEAREDLIEWLMRTRVVRLTPEGASDDIKRDIEAGRRVGLQLVSMLQGDADEHGK